VISYEQLLQVFWENHDPAQGMRQGNDHGTQYRSAIYPLTPEQDAAARDSLARFQQAMLAANDDRQVTTEIATALPFYYAEDDHQQYLHKNPYGYCGIGGIGVCLPPQLAGVWPAATTGLIMGLAPREPRGAWHCLPNRPLSHYPLTAASKPVPAAG